MRRENCVNTQRYSQTVAEVYGTWCTKNHTHPLFPVDTSSGKMTVQKTSLSVFNVVAALSTWGCS